MLEVGSLFDALRDEIALRLERGESLRDVEKELIEPATGVNDDERAGLWLFAWSYAQHARHSLARELISVGR
jgi:hypothetical protein